MSDLQNSSFLLEIFCYVDLKVPFRYDANTVFGELNRLCSKKEPMT